MWRDQTMHLSTRILGKMYLREERRLGKKYGERRVVNNHQDRLMHASACVTLFCFIVNTDLNTCLWLHLGMFLYVWWQPLTLLALKVSVLLVAYKAYYVWEDFIIASALRISCKHLLVWDAEGHSFVGKKDISEVYTASFKGEQRITFDMLLSSSLFILSLCFIPTLLFVCSRSAGEKVDLSGPDTNPLGFSLSTQRPATFSILFYLSYTLQSLFSALSALSAAFSFPPFGIPVSPSLRSPLSFSPSLPCCLHLRLSYWFL